MGKTIIVCITRWIGKTNQWIIVFLCMYFDDGIWRLNISFNMRYSIITMPDDR